MPQALVTLGNTSIAARLAAVHDAVRALEPGPMHESQRRAGEAMLTVLSEDSDPEIRLEIARLLGPHPLAPRHVILTMAADDVAISALVLAQSPLLIDGELARLARDGEPEAQIAVACREPLSASLANVISVESCRDACLALVQNPAAAPEVAALHRIAERFGADDEIRRNLLKHEVLAPKTRVLLIAKLGEKLARDAAGEGVSSAKADTMARECCDKALIALAAGAADEEVADICQAIIEQGHMTAALLLRCVLVGNIELFSRAVARLSGMPNSRVNALLAQGREAAFRALCVRAGLSRNVGQVLWHCIGAWRLALADGQPLDTVQVVWTISTAALQSYQPHDADDPVLVLLRRVCAESARERARSDFTNAFAESRVAAVAEIAPPFETMAVEPEVVAAFALHFAEEILDLETSLAANSDLAQSDVDILDDVVPATAATNDDTAIAEFAALLEAEMASAHSSEMPEFSLGEIANDEGEQAPPMRQLDVAAA